MTAQILATMPPGMTGLLLRIDLDPEVTPQHVHGPMLKGLMTRGLVRLSGNRLQVTWSGQKVINLMEEQA